MACLIATNGPARGQFFALARHKLVLIGRDDRCTFQILDGQISRQHLHVRFDEEKHQHFASDFRSVNGVIVNGTKIDKEKALSDGDRIAIGETTLTYSAVDYPDATHAMAAMKKEGEWNRSTVVYRNE